MRNIQSYDQMLKSYGLNITGDNVVEDLKKALSTNTSGPGGNQAGPLMLENLDAIMTEVLITEEHFKLYNLLGKVPSAQPYFEYNKHKGRGNGRGSLGFAEGGTPTGGNSSFERKGIYNKYLGRKGGVTHQMLIAGQNGGAFSDPSIQENRDRTIELLEMLERNMVFGRADIKDGDGNEVNMNGILTELASQYAANVIDMEGAAFGFAQLDEAAVDLKKTGKVPSVNGYTCLMSVDVANGINRQYQDRNIVRHNKDGADVGVYTPGFKVPAYQSQFGNIGFDDSILLEEVDNSAPLSATSSGAPAAPATVAGTAATEATSKMVAATYYYFAAAVNDNDESLPTASTGVVVTAGQKVTVAIARVTGATGYRIYRGLSSDATKAKWIAHIPQPASGDASFVDLNGWRTADSSGNAENGLAILVKPETKDICISQMTPLVKMPLPQVGTTFPFLLLLYIVLVLKAPERVKIYKNCGKYTPA